eukprot:CAMPEP_0181340252 /NCGR_PEP_ID=MMETSP1101-20121128/29737_1 /TAXON_ID=46948 /ORGANISM="Rhodomonas abbreviata, Strain Caron Lab Isolate" /LENGTH=102 /DNA_ID=CAMNT_0023451369 /DNA_START=208 /DNA_END=514 /DNA_ORIENTATION=+
MTKFSFFDKATKETFRVKQVKMEPLATAGFGGKPAAKQGKKPAKAAGFSKQAIATSPEWAACRSWIEQHGRKADVEICEVAPGLRGIVAMRNVAKGDEIFSI